MLRAAEEIGRADRFVGFLGVLRGRLIDPRLIGQIFLAVLLADQLAAGIDRVLAERHTVGTHIADDADRLAAEIDTFIEALGDLHGLGRAETELARGFLLHGRGGEGRVGIALHRLTLDGGHGERRAGFHLGDRRLGIGFGRQVELVELLAVEMGQARGELGSVGSGEDRLDGPELAGFEGFDLGLALADDAQSHGLDTTRRTATGQLPPQDRREGEADEVIQGPAREIGIDQFLVDLPGIGDGFEDGALGDLVEGDALHRELGEALLGPELFDDMPGDGFAFAIRVGGEDQLVRLLGGGGDLFQLLGAAAFDLPAHLKVFVGSDRAVLRRQVADMAETGQDMVVAAQILINGLGFGR